MDFFFSSRGTNDFSLVIVLLPCRILISFVSHWVNLFQQVFYFSWVTIKVNFCVCICCVCTYTYKHTYTYIQTYIHNISMCNIYYVYICISDVLWASLTILLSPLLISQIQLWHTLTLLKSCSNKMIQSVYFYFHRWNFPHMLFNPLKQVTEEKV